MLSINFMIGVSLLLLAFVGGVIGTWHTIGNAQGPRERTFAIRTSLGCWLLVISMLGAMTFTDGYMRKYILVVYFIGGPILLYRWSTKHMLLRLLDQRENEDPEKDKS